MTNQFQLSSTLYPIWLNQKGYPCITVQDQEKERAYLLHRIVYEAAHGPVPEGHDIHHIDGDKSNWALTNLAAMTRKSHLDLHRRARSTEQKNRRRQQDGDGAGEKPDPEPAG